MKEPSPMPDAVIDSVFNAQVHRTYCPKCDTLINADARDAHRILREIKWAGDHYYFMLAGMYVGVETDGYMHT